MKQKKIVFLCFLLINIALILIFISSSVKAQAKYELEISEDDRYTWEVTEVNYYNFEKTFGFEPSFEKGDQMTIEITDIDKITDGWSLTLEIWDYKSDKEKEGVRDYSTIYEDPKDYEDNIFVPTPVDEYFEEAEEDLPSEYIVEVGLSETGTEEAKVTRRESDYTVVKEYNFRGIVVVEEWTDADDIVLARVEATFRYIPMVGWEYIIGVVVFATIGIILVMIKKKKFSIKMT